MRKNKLIRLFRKMSGSELHRFTLFVHSPYFNKSTNCQKLLDEILKYGPTFTSPKLDKQRLLKKVYPSAKSLSNLTTDFSKLLGLLERFVVQENINRNQFTFNKVAILSEFYEEKEEYKVVESIQKKQIKYYEEHQSGDDAYYHQMFSQMPIFVRTDYFNKNQAFQFLGEGFAKYVFLRLLKDECHLRAINSKHQIKHTLPLSEVLLPLLENDFKYLLEIPMIKLYDTYYKTFDGDKYPKAGIHFLDLLLSNLAPLNKDDKYHLFVAAVNICYRNKELSELEKRKEILRIYKLMINEDVLLKRKILGLSRYMNIVVAAANCGEFDWATTFIETNIKFIKKSLPVKEIELSGKAILAFYQKNYNKAISYLADYKKLLPANQELPKKAMEIRCLYELEIWNEDRGIERMESLIKRFERYLFNYPKNVSILKCDLYKRFFQLTAILFRYKTNQISYPKENIFEKIKSAKCMHDDWLIDKYYEL